MKRRDFMKTAGALTAHLLAGQAVLTTTSIAQAQSVTGLSQQTLSSLKQRITGADGSLVLFPSDAQSAAYQVAFNRRTLKMAQVRVLPTTTNAVLAAVQWAQEFNVPFATRGGGHSYEGYSQSEGLVIDMRLMKTVEYDATKQTATVQAGAQLSSVYEALAKFNRAIPAGSCPTVGVAGHTLGGGFGLLGRKFGLACDSLIEVEIVTSGGVALIANENINEDLFWALRGGGNGNFGIVTKFKFQTHKVGNSTVYGLTWVLPLDRALKVAKAWQDWAPNAPDDITSIFKFYAGPNGQIKLHAAGASQGSAADLKRELEALTKVETPSLSKVKTLSFIQGIHYFGGSTDYPSVFMKAKSDYLFEPMSDDGFIALMKGVQAAPKVVAICDSYGGAIGRIANADTAFAHREGTRFCIQYYTEWSNAADTASRLKPMRDLYASMRPYVSGQCYVNYCDLDLPNGPAAYWGDNLKRLMQVKTMVDPQNLFTHAQAVPLQAAGVTK